MCDFMAENELKRLIELNENIVSQNKTLIAQNERIIRLLTKLTGDNNDAVNINAIVAENGEVVIGENLFSPVKNDKASLKQKENIEEKSEIGNDNDNTVLDLELVSGEVLFVSNSSDGEIDIYKLSVKSCDEFNVIPQEIQSEIEDEIGIVNNEITIENLTGNGMTSQFKIPLLVAFESFNQDLPIDSSTDVIFDNLPEILRISIENGASKVYLSLKNAMAILNAPPMITDYLEFYKTREHILEKLNLNNE